MKAPVLTPPALTSPRPSRVEAAPETAPPIASPPWLSVLIPVFNVAPYLAACIASVFDQGVPGVEVLALDDASTDGSGELLQRLATTYPGLQVFRRSRNAGISEARNQLLDQARGAYIWFLDSDDLLAPGAIESLRALLQREPVDLVLCDYLPLLSPPPCTAPRPGVKPRPTFSGPGRQRITSVSRLVEGIFRARCLYAWARISRRQLWNLPTPWRFPQGKVYEDIPAAIQLALRAGSTWHEPEPWVYYRRRAGSIVNTPTARSASDFAEAMRGLRAPLMGAGLDAHARQAWMAFTIRNFVAAGRMTRKLVQPDTAAPPTSRITLDEAQRLRRAHLDALEASLPMPVAQLQRQLWLQGHWVQAWRLLRGRRLFRSPQTASSKSS
ncbi:Glycosyl transferase family 2 [Roseateles sp. YR242]|uniref:glycosyltransferase family 2 protein n=1 Tax=Roseateles sp. YR242 TaxID=1855305 RepID=UPI0008C0388F|nr:glycosyltransferase family 2 protein [Roseateles sp. YR242]SEL42730.1 Glycosyl transferase family 2 [Roseateles sp. YR242]